MEDIARLFWFLIPFFGSAQAVCFLRQSDKTKDSEERVYWWDSAPCIHQHRGSKAQGRDSHRGSNNKSDGSWDNQMGKREILLTHIYVDLFSLFLRASHLEMSYFHFSIPLNRPCDGRPVQGECFWERLIALLELDCTTPLTDYETRMRSWRWWRLVASVSHFCNFLKKINMLAAKCKNIQKSSFPNPWVTK